MPPCQLDVLIRLKWCPVHRENMTSVDPCRKSRPTLLMLDTVVKHPSSLGESNKKKDNEENRPSMLHIRQNMHSSPV
jgi:hypothetical protein